RARGEPLRVTRELEARIDADAPDVREIVDIEAREIARLFGRAERAESRGELVVCVCIAVCEMREPRAFGQIRAPDDAQREARIAALQEAHGGLDGVYVALGVREEVRDRRG